MKLFPLLLLCMIYGHAQPQKKVRQLVALVLNEEPDRLGNANNYLLLADQPEGVVLQPNQTFVLRSAWKKEGDSITNIGTGTFKETDGYTATLNVTILPGKTVQKADIAMFLVPLKIPGKDSIIFKMARFAINFTTVTDSNFYDRNTVLQKPTAYSTARIAKAMAADIQFTAKQMLLQNDGQDQEIKSGPFKGRQLFATMKKATAKEVIAFLLYVYARPDKYMAHTFKVSETFATWLINGSPMVRGN